MYKIIVLGAGMVGSAMAIDLAKNHQVTSADLNLNSLNKIKAKQPNITTLQIDVTKKEKLIKTLKFYDLVICAVPGFLGYQTLKTIITAKKNVVDISFFPENALELNELAKQNKITAIVDCGVAPGMGNILLGYHNEHMTVTDFECLVGGLPKTKKWPFNYKAPFSPIDVIEEYTRPARYIENNKLVTKEALSDVELINFDTIGTLESFNSDGLRSLIYTMPHIPNMKEKTLRYPGHIEYIQVLKKSGFFDSNKIEINGVEISPIDFTNKILFKEWLLEEEEELTIMKITIKGTNKKGENKTIIYDLLDTYCKDTQTSSMARTTGYTATAAAHLVLDGLFTEKGVFPPELVGRHKICYDYVLEYLKSRNVTYLKTEL
ncbi:MAG: saccharopine dehydrogenase NADP-binding domain-containing protein [Flavobacteriaceae bacterium]|nr:saccharopine dehydrogenase NADP-binding domain-containing protein [Flavobacteriaceae bacterium]